jgi:hypothetical protein
MLNHHLCSSVLLGLEQEGTLKPPGLRRLSP